MEVLPRCVGAPRVEPKPDHKVEVTFTKDSTIYRLSAEEAVALGERLVQAGRQAA